MKEQTRIFFGGTFNPVHVGHARLALEVQQQVKAQQFQFVPCHVPPHKPVPEVDVGHRLAMLALVVAQLNNRAQTDDTFAIEPCELERSRASYTTDTLALLRQKYPQDKLLWLIGMDSVANLESWHDWRHLTEHANLLVVNRPGYEVPQAGALATWLADRITSPAELNLCGGVMFINTTPLPVSSSAIRHQLRQGASALYLLPECVQSYIDNHNLYS